MQRFTKAIAAIMLTVAVTVGCKKDNADGDGIYNGHTYVDLGLPSGTLWAACNVGADSPEDYGSYFAWGETQPKTVYSWDTYKWCNGGSHQLTKYCNDSDCGYNGFTDNLTMLQLEDDAATANWGSGWCMPTKEQWAELQDNTTSTWTTQNGVNGMRFAANNGQSIFLPAAGCWVSDLYGVGGDGYYWSSSLLNYHAFDSWDFIFFSNDCDLSSHYRSGGFSVRPVREK